MSANPMPVRSAVLPTKRMSAAPIQPVRRASVLPTTSRQMASRVLQGQQQAWYQLPLFPMRVVAARPIDVAADNIVASGNPLGDSPLAAALAAR